MWKYLQQITISLKIHFLKFKDIFLKLKSPGLKVIKFLILKRFFLLKMTVVISFIFIAFQSYSIISYLPDVEKLSYYEPAVPTLVYSRDGVKIAEVYTEKRYPIGLKQMSTNLKNAFISAEDADFYKHHGLDWKGFLRAVYHMLTLSEQKQGGSTITQQLAKNLLLTKERTISRKIKDMLVARNIERHFSKDKILELYLNAIYLGNNSYGVQAAALNYFHKNASELSLAQAALIAGLAPAPSRYDPTVNYSAAKLRQSYVLGQMLNRKHINKTQYKNALREKIVVYRDRSQSNEIAHYFVEEVKKQMQEHVAGEDISVSGYTVYTTLDSRIQKSAFDAVKQFAKEHEETKSFRGPVKEFGKNYTKELKRFLIENYDEGKEKQKAVVIDINEKLKYASVLSPNGFGVIPAEDIDWALYSSRNKKTMEKKFSYILKIGDVVNVEKISDKPIQRITKNKKIIEHFNSYSSYYPKKISQSISRYTLSDFVNIEAAVLFMDANTGQVLAMVGGNNFMESQFNRATQAQRQVGSSVKPLYYSYALDNGFSPVSLIDSPNINIGGWRPRNYNNQKSERTTLRNALAKSLNIPSIFLYQNIGASKASHQLNRFGFNWPTSDLSVALGSGSSTLLRMVQAYSIFPNHGKLTQAYYIEKIVDRKGNVIFEASKNKIYPCPVNPVIPEDASYLPGTSHNKIENESLLQIISPQAAYVSLNMLQNVVSFGTGTAANGVSPYVAGKTGTTNGNTDAWFMGIASNIVGGVWVGFDDNSKSLGSGGTGGNMPVYIWRSTMKKAVEIFPQIDWEKPGGIETIKVTNDNEDSLFFGQQTNVPVIDGTLPGEPYARNALKDNSEIPSYEHAIENSEKLIKKLRDGGDDLQNGIPNPGEGGIPNAWGTIPNPGSTKN